GGRVGRIRHYIIDLVLGYAVLHDDVNVVAIGVIFRIPDYRHLPPHTVALPAAGIGDRSVGPRQRNRLMFISNKAHSVKPGAPPGRYIHRTRTSGADLPVYPPRLMTSTLGKTRRPGL